VVQLGTRQLRTYRSVMEELGELLTHSVRMCLSSVTVGQIVDVSQYGSEKLVWTPHQVLIWYEHSVAKQKHGTHSTAVSCWLQYSALHLKQENSLHLTCLTGSHALITTMSLLPSRCNSISYIYSLFYFITFRPQSAIFRC
jgi:hypothetical protein